MNWINLVSLVDWIIHLCQLYSEDEEKTHNVKYFVYKKKIKNIIVYILEI